MSVKAVGITRPTVNLHNAVKALREDDVVKAALGQHIYTNFVETKKVRVGLLRPIRLSMGDRQLSLSLLNRP